MTPKDLELEELGYTHARHKQPCCLPRNPHYRRGYQHGEHDNRTHTNLPQPTPDTSLLRLPPD
jgi:hypothetical protein